MLMYSPFSMRGEGGKNAFGPLICLIDRPANWFVNSSLSIMVTIREIALYVPQFNFDGPPKSEVRCLSKEILILIDFQALYRKFV